MIEAAPLSAGTRVEPADRARGEAVGEAFVLRNRRLRVAIDGNGTITSIRDLTANRETLAGAANELMLFDDRPVIWDAWDVDPHLFEKPIRLPDATFGAA